jgi:hypothetical protein
MTFAERAAKRARAIYEAALFSTLMQQESATAAELGDEFVILSIPGPVIGGLSIVLRPA